MLIRRAAPEDRPGIRRLAERLDLDYPGMESDPFWAAEEDGMIAGIVGLKRHADSDELVSLGVDPARRLKGLGRRLVESLAAEVPGAVFLATVNPGFFARCGFTPIPSGPVGMMAKEAAWCEGCPRERCTVMIRKKR
ncbi:MAG: GNAT family N-acetyltransferase [Candidatus Aminicenantales bacterium]